MSSRADSEESVAILPTSGLADGAPSLYTVSLHINLPMLSKRVMAMLDGRLVI